MTGLFFGGRLWGGGGGGGGGWNVRPWEPKVLGKMVEEEKTEGKVRWERRSDRLGGNKRSV